MKKAAPLLKKGDRSYQPYGTMYYIVTYDTFRCL